MISKIRLLTDDVINKIAAGEIIERPASIVKELVENSIDAESTQIKIFIEHGGIRSICIMDNGCGMTRDDAILAFDRHATSKISSSEDLDTISTMGFRGEAIASIAAISNVEMETKQEDEMAGTKIEVSGGVLKNVIEIGCHTGTKITVTNLFYNVPARRKFLKTVNTEFTYIINNIIQYILVFPEIAFVLVNNNHVVYDFPKTKNIEERIYSIYGKDLTNNLLKIKYKIEKHDIEISGFVSKPAYSKPNKNYQHTFVNNRSIKSKVINHAIYEGYHTFLMIDRHPLAIININVPSSFVDVNVHPTKKEVKFIDDRILHSSLCEAISNTLKSDSSRAIKNGNVNNIYSNKETESELEEVKESQQNYNVPLPQKTNYNLNEYALFNKSCNTAFEDNSSIITLRPLAQIKRTYWIVEDEKETYIIDQHALHERVLYKKILDSLQNKHFEVQRLLFPINVELTASETEFIKDNLEKLISFGIDIEYFGGVTFIIKEVPIYLISVNLKDFLCNIYNEFNIDKAKFNFLEQTVILMSCHGAIKAGDVITKEEMVGILREAEKLKIPFFCPHGRPAMVKISTEELEKKFKR